MRTFSRAIYVIIVSVMIMSFVTSCSILHQLNISGLSPSPSNVQGSLLSEQPTDTPLRITDTPITFRIWAPLNSIFIDAGNQTFNDVLGYQELERRTGVHIEWEHPLATNADESFNLMIYSGEYTDMVLSTASVFQGGNDKAISDGVFIRLNEWIDSSAPYYKKLQNSDEEIARRTITDSGNIAFFYTLSVDKEPPFFGPMVRADWLEDLGIMTPDTMDDWHTMLTAFKQRKGVDAPLLLNNMGLDNGLMNGFGVTSDGFFQVDGKVTHNVLEPGYLEYLTLANTWYQEGLIDQDFYTKTAFLPDEPLVASGKTGAFTHLHGVMDIYMQEMTDKNATFTAVPYPTISSGEKVHLGMIPSKVGSGGISITTACKDPETAVKWVDYNYSDEGSLLGNYGIEGVTFNMVDGEPELSDLIMNNPDGLTINNALHKYLVTSGMAKIYDWHRVYAATSEAVNRAGQIWGAEMDFAWSMPPITLTVEEGSELIVIMADIETYINEMTIKFILGSEPLTKFDDFVNKVKEMGIDQAVSIQQAALDRYEAR